MTAFPIAVVEKNLFSKSLPKVFAKSVVTIHRGIKLLKVFYERNMQRFQSTVLSGNILLSTI